MEPARPAILLTRPEAPSRRFAAQICARLGADWPILIAPLTAIRFLSPALPERLPHDVLFTSETAVRAFVGLSPARSQRAWCVGPRTEAVARAAGFATRLGPGDAAGLVRVIAASGKVRQILYPRPVHAAGDLEVTLTSAGIETISVLTYDQVALPLSGPAAALLGGSAPVLLPLFSPRSAALAARAIAALAPRARGDATAPLWFAAISPAVAAAVAGLPVRGGITAERPDADAMLDALSALIAAAMTG